MDLYLINSEQERADFFRSLLTTEVLTNQLTKRTELEWNDNADDEIEIEYYFHKTSNILLFSYNTYTEDWNILSNWKQLFHSWNGKLTTEDIQRFMLCKLLNVPITVEQEESYEDTIENICINNYKYVTFTPLLNKIIELIPSSISQEMLISIARNRGNENKWVLQSGQYINGLWRDYFHSYGYLSDPQIIIPTRVPEMPIIHEAPLEILGYSTRVETILPVKQSSDTRFGIELELENATEENLEIIHKHLKKHAIMKRDGSLNRGVEIVSVPDSIENHKKIYKPFFDDQHNLKAENNCGIHIHVTREKMSFLTLGRIMKFMSHNKQHVYKIAGRKSDHYAKVEDNWDLTSAWYAVNEDQKYRKNPRFNWSKYTGLNIAPSRTMEFRIFKSTTNYEEFCRFLEFTEALVNYCSLAGDDNKGKIKKVSDMFTFKNFHDFVASRGKAYPAFNKFLATI